MPKHAAPHMGSAYPTIAADVMARFHRLQGRRVTFITGTDEHGEKIALAAEKRGMQPEEHCDDIVASYRQLWQDVSITSLVDFWCIVFFFLSFSKPPLVQLHRHGTSCFITQPGPLKIAHTNSCGFDLHHIVAVGDFV
jgi:hypothetical protein